MEMRWQNFGGTGDQNSKTPEPINEKFDVGLGLWVITPAMTSRMPKLKNDHPIGGMAVYA